MRCKVKNLYPGPGSNEFVTNWVEQYPDDLLPSFRDKKEFKSHALIVRYKVNTKGEFGMHVHSVTVQSPLLKSVLKEVFHNYPELSFSNFELEHLEFQHPFWPFVHRWDEFEKAAHQEADTEAVKHTQLLYEIVHKELETDMSMFQDLINHGLIDFDHLWALFRPGELIVDISRHGFGIWAHRFTIGHYEESPISLPAFVLESQYVDWNGKYFGTANCVERISHFKGSRPITDLALYPMKFYPFLDQLHTTLVQRGRKFEALQGCKYKSYNGSARTSTFGTRIVSQTIKMSNIFADLLKVSGRIIIDCGAYLQNTGVLSALEKLPEPVSGKSEYASSGLDLESCLDVLRDVSPSGSPLEHEWTVPGQPSKCPDILCTSFVALMFVQTWNVCRKSIYYYAVQFLEGIVYQARPGVCI
jgi:hypothetical protein